MKTAGNGDRIKVHYTGMLDDGMVFDSSKNCDPMEFVIGTGQLIRDFEDAVVGMAVGETKTVHIPAERAYGAFRDDLSLEVPLDTFPENIEPKEGLALCLQRNDGSSLNVVVTAVTDTTATLDANHPLAGKDLTFDIEMVSIEEAGSSTE
jgi:FKBP-type peptidyl-prolyl cis-trans isomerase 2